MVHTLRLRKIPVRPVVQAHLVPIRRVNVHPVQRGIFLRLFLRSAPYVTLAPLLVLGPRTARYVLLILIAVKAPASAHRVQKASIQERVLRIATVVLAFGNYNCVPTLRRRGWIICGCLDFLYL